MEVTGIVRHALEMRSGVSQKTGKSWASRDYVLEIPGQYTSHMVFTVFGEDRMSQFALRKDEQVTVQFDIDANEYNGKWYNRITAYGVSRPTAAPPQQPAAQYQQPVQQQPTAAYQPPQQTQQGNDDLPF